MLKKKLLLFLTTLLLVSCENSMEEINRLSFQDEIKTEVAENVEILYSDSANIRVRITAPTLLTYLDRANPHQEFPNGIKAEFYDNFNTKASTLTGKYAIRYQNKNETFIQDSVVWVSAKGERLETEELIWDENKAVIYSNKFVVMNKPDEVIYSYGFKANQDFTRAEFNAIEGQFKANDITKDLE